MEEINGKNVRFTNRSGNRKKEYKATLSYDESNFHLSYNVIKEEKSVDENNTPILKKTTIQKKEVGVFSEILSISRYIPFFNLIIDIGFIIAIIVLISMDSYLPIIYVLAAGISLFLLYDSFRDIYSIFVSYNIKFHNQVTYLIKFRTHQEGAEFAQLIKSHIVPLSERVEEDDDEDDDEESKKSN